MYSIRKFCFEYILNTYIIIYNFVAVLLLLAGFLWVPSFSSSNKWRCAVYVGAQSRWSTGQWNTKRNPHPNTSDICSCFCCCKY